MSPVALIQRPNPGSLVEALESSKAEISLKLSQYCTNKTEIVILTKASLEPIQQ